MKNKENLSSKNSFYWIYFIGIFLILALPVFVLPPWLFPVDWGKTIVFRTILSILLFLFIFQFIFRRNELNLPKIKNNKTLWILTSLFVVFLLASIFSVDPYFSFWGSPVRSGGFINFVFYILFAAFSFIILKNSEWEKVINFSIFIGFLVGLLAAFQFNSIFSNFIASTSYRPSSTSGNPIMLATYMVLMVFLALPNLFKKIEVWKKILYSAAIILFLYVILIDESRAAYFGLTIGMIYFIWFLQRKTNIIKITAIFLALIIFLAGLGLYYINTSSQFPNFLEKNIIFQQMESRLKLSSLFNNDRYAAWKVGLEAAAQKPILGWGPENFAVGFDKFYDPKVPSLNIPGNTWWDKAHNTLVEILATAGAPALIIYLSLFIFLFWHLDKTKHKTEIREVQIICHALQAALIAYLIAIFFSFDDFSTYLTFFILVGYSMHLISINFDNQANNPKEEKKYKKVRGGWAIISATFIALIIFLWQYNFVPFEINAQINKATFTVNANCIQALSMMENVLPQRSFLDSYERLKYVEFLKTCASVHPENNLAYAEKGAQLLSEASKIQPFYTRTWIYLGGFKTIIADNEQDPKTKQNLLTEASLYLDKAYKLSPRRPETLIEKSKLDVASGNYQKMKNDAEECTAIDPGNDTCYWMKSLSEIYLKDFDSSDKDAKTALEKGFNPENSEPLNQLLDAYIYLKDYKDLIVVYSKLININPGFAQYHASLAFVYKELGNYEQARVEASTFLKLSPEAKDEVNAFLKTLPY